MAREGLTKKVAFEQRPEEGMLGSCLREECAREKEAAVQEVTPNTWTACVLKEKEPLLH